MAGFTEKEKAYYKKREETKKYMNSFTDFYGRVFTCCSECVKSDCKNRIEGTDPKQGCMQGKLKDDLKKYL